MQYVEFIALFSDKRILWSSPRRPAGRPRTDPGIHCARLAVNTQGETIPDVLRRQMGNAG